MLRHSFFLLILLFAGASAVSAQGWKKLGSKMIDFKNVNDAIVIEQKSRPYSKFKVRVSGASVRISRLILTYSNGEKRRFTNGFTIENGESTNEVDIGATNAGIERVDFWYESRSLNAKKAKIILYALTAK